MVLIWGLVLLKVNPKENQIILVEMCIQREEPWKKFKSKPPSALSLP
jgi:hypothetical protein